MLGALEQGLEGKAPLNCQIGWMGIFHSEDLDGFHDTPWMKVWGDVMAVERHELRRNWRDMCDTCQLGRPGAEIS